MLSWMFLHDYLDTYCLSVLYACVSYFLYLHLFSTTEQFHMERRSRNMLIIIICLRQLYKLCEVSLIDNVLSWAR